MHCSQGCKKTHSAGRVVPWAASGSVGTGGGEAALGASTGLAGAGTGAAAGAGAGGASAAHFRVPGEQW